MGCHRSRQDLGSPPHVRHAVTSQIDHLTVCFTSGLGRRAPTPVSVDICRPGLTVRSVNMGPPPPVKTGSLGAGNGAGQMTAWFVLRMFRVMLHGWLAIIPRGESPAFASGLPYQTFSSVLPEPGRLARPRQTAMSGGCQKREENKRTRLGSSRNTTAADMGRNANHVLFPGSLLPWAGVARPEPRDEDPRSSAAGEGGCKRLPGSLPHPASMTDPAMIT